VSASASRRGGRAGRRWRRAIDCSWLSRGDTAYKTSALDPSGSARPLFAVEGFPTIVVIDRNGFIRAKWEGLNPAIGLAMSNADGRLRN